MPAPLEPPQPYVLSLDGDWEFWELSLLGRQYVQCYCLYHVLLEANRGDDFSREHLLYSLNRYPWRGGWSSTDFFGSAMSWVHPLHRPRIRRIQYSSPGFVELLIGLRDAATSVKWLVENFRQIRPVYTAIHNRLRESELLSKPPKRRTPTQEQMVEGALQELLNSMEMGEFDRMLTAADRLKTLKVMLAYCRRIRHLSELHDKDKIVL